MAVREINTDPLRNFKFHVKIHHNLGGVYGDMTRLGFMSVTGLAASTEVISYREGGDNTTPRKMPGQTDFPPVSLTRGLVKSKKGVDADADVGLLWQWYRQIFFVNQGGVPHGMTSSVHGVDSDFKCDVVIKVFDHPVTKRSTGNGIWPNTPNFGPARIAFRLYNAWPASLAFSDLDAGGNGVMVNNMTLMYEGFDVMTGSILANALGNDW